MDRPIEDLLQEMDKENIKRDNDFIISVTPCAWTDKNKKFACGIFPYGEGDYVSLEYGSSVEMSIRNYYDSEKWKFIS